MGPHSIPNEKKGNLTGMVLLDLQKAFDTEDHGIFLMKLDAIGLNADSLRCFQSYLSGRIQLVDVQSIVRFFHLTGRVANLLIILTVHNGL